MTRLILTADSSAAGALELAGLGDLVIAVERRLVWGPLPSEAQLEAFFAERRAQDQGLHWLDDTPPWRLEKSGAKDLGLLELFARCDSVELWMGPEPNAQLMLLWLLDHWRDKAVRGLLRHVDVAIGDTEPRLLAKLKVL